MESTLEHRTTSRGRMVRPMLNLGRGGTATSRWLEGYTSRLTTTMTATSGRGIKVCVVCGEREREGRKGEVKRRRGSEREEESEKGKMSE